MKDYEKTTAFLGQWGPFQKIVFFLLCTSTVPNGFSAFSVIFLADIPDHHCQIPGTNLSEDWIRASIPTKAVNGKLELSKCRRYKLDIIRNLSSQGCNPEDIDLTDIEQEKCVDGWTYSKDIYQSTIVTEEEERNTKPKESNNVLDLMRTSNIRRTTLILFLVWLTLSMGYFGLSLNTSRLHGDPFVNCFISAAIEVPAYITSWLSLRYLPRRLSCSASMLLGGGVLYFIQLVPPSLPSLSVALEMMGKFGIAIGTALMFTYTGELYPTVLRNTAVGSCAMVSRVGSAIAPYFIHLNVYHQHLPYILLGTLCLLSSTTTLFLPESFNQPLPETIGQMQKRDTINCSCFSRKHEEKDLFQDTLSTISTSVKILQEERF
ncbi:hypothetical protein MHYP_G00216230 [Metynnis hypsauchen]